VQLLCGLTGGGGTPKFDGSIFDLLICCCDATGPLPARRADTPLQTSAPMAVPKRRQSNARTGSRRAHDHKKPKQLTYCPQCSTAVPTHAICPKCGTYMGRTVMKVE
jgi:large subunit ribosomal protein L32